MRKQPGQSGGDSGVLVRFGGQVKALGNGKFEAPLVQFTDADDPDLTGDFFNADTDFWKDFPASIPLIYAHAQDPTLKSRRLGVKTCKGLAALAQDDAGIWMSGQLDLRDSYEAAIYQMIEAGKMGTSSGSSAHLVERQDCEGSKGCWIKSWPLVEASLTPTPAESRNTVVPVKSIKGLLSYEWSAEGHNGAFNGIGEDLTAAGLRRMFDAILWRCCDVLDDDDPEGSAATAKAMIDQFAEYAKRYIGAIVTAFSDDAKDAEYLAIKSLTKQAGRPADIKAFEKLLRDACGFSRKEATAIASHGFNGLLRDAESRRDNNDDIKQALIRESLQLDSRTVSFATAKMETTAGVNP